MASTTIPSILAPTDRPRFLSEDDAQALMERLSRYAQGGGFAGVYFRSKWMGNVRWARNLVSSSGETEDNQILVMRDIRGAHNPCVFINEITDEALVAGLRKAERLLQFDRETPDTDVITHVQLEPELHPELFSETTYQLGAEQRAAYAHTLTKSAADAGMLSAGYVQVMAHSEALLTSWGTTIYNRYTWAQYSVTVRDPKGVGSGWAGVDWPDWNRIDGAQLSQIALDKCLQSRNPVAIEPGRYTTILEPQAVGEFVGKLMATPAEYFTNRNEYDPTEAFNKRPMRVPGDPGAAKFGERIIDERLTIRADPMDPDLGFPTFGYWPTNQDPWSLLQSHVFQPVTWVKDGTLASVEYERDTAIFTLGRNLGQVNSGAFRIDVDGPTATVEEMIATTKRGILVTRFDQIESVGRPMCRGYTRDGLWLIENGKISKPIMNMAFTESPLFALNNIEQLGTPKRIFHPQGNHWWGHPEPIIVPAMKIRDFSFTALSDAI